MKTSELQGAALDWAVAKAEGENNLYWDDENLCFVDGFDVEFRPSSCWEHGGPIIEREKIGVWWATHYIDDDGEEYGNHWYAESAESLVGYGPTPLVAAMRCYVASKLGEEVEVPEEVTQQTQV